MKYLRSIIVDTLKNNGRWSRKSITMFSSFFISVIMGFFILISDLLLKIEINRYAIDVFNSFMLLTAALSGVTVIDKKFTNKNNDWDNSNAPAEDDCEKEHRKPNKGRTNHRKEAKVPNN